MYIRNFQEHISFQQISNLNFFYTQMTANKMKSDIRNKQRECILKYVLIIPYGYTREGLVYPILQLKIKLFILQI